MSIAETAAWQGPIDFIDLKAQHRRVAEGVERRMREVIAHGQFIMGPEVAELEERLGERLGVRHAIGVSDGTTALQIALMALGVGAGDEVITTPFTFIATAETISLLGAVPVFVDIDPETYNIDPARIEAAITARTRAIMPVSLYGQCADLDAVNRIAARHGLPVIEDAAQSLGATSGGRPSGSMTTIACTSFFPSKPLGCYGDGGMCFTHDDTLATAMRQIRVHGQEQRYVHGRIGLNGRLDTLQAAILLAKLEAFDEDVRERAAAGARYDRLFREAGLGGRVKTPTVRPGNVSVYAQYTIAVDDREALRAAVQRDGVPTAVHYPVCLHRQPLYAKGGCVAHEVPHAEAAAERVISLPMYPAMPEALQQHIVDLIRRHLG